LGNLDFSPPAGYLAVFLSVETCRFVIAIVGFESYLDLVVFAAYAADVKVAVMHSATPHGCVGWDRWTEAAVALVSCCLGAERSKRMLRRAELTRVVRAARGDGRICHATFGSEVAAVQVGKVGEVVGHWDRCEVFGSEVAASRVGKVGEGVGVVEDAVVLP